MECQQTAAKMNTPNMVIENMILEYDFFIIRFSVLPLRCPSNAPVKLRAERARFLTASKRKSVNAKEPSASTGCYAVRINKIRGH